MTNDEKLARAARAQALLNDDLLQESFAKLDADYIAAWRSTDARDDDARQRLWQAVNVLGKVKDHLSRVIADGKIAKAEIDALAERKA